MENIYLKAALEYEKLGFSVVPLVPGSKFPPKGVTWVNREFRSPDECMDEEWKKDHPGVSWGRATPEEIKQWWKDHPKSHVGMITGAISGIDSVDLDGPYARDILEAATGVDLPESISYRTGREDSGIQTLFKYHGGGLTTKAGYVTDGNGNGVDLKTDGGLTVLPPSVHKSGKRYEWIIDPTEMGLNDLEVFPWELFAFMVEQCKDSVGNGRQKDRVDSEKWIKEGIPDGLKHHGLFRFACKKISQGLCYDEILLLTTEVARACDPLPKDGPEKAARVRVDEAFEKYGTEYSHSDEWVLPTDITRPIPPAPKFPLDCLPDVCRDFLSDAALRLQVSADMIAMPLLGTLAGVIGSGVVIHPKAKDDWEERACLWVMVIASKSTMKSIALKTGTKDLRRLQAEKAAEFLVENEGMEGTRGGNETPEKSP